MTLVLEPSLFMTFEYFVTNDFKYTDFSRYVKYPI
jgi:hypothetical protein